MRGGGAKPVGDAVRRSPSPAPPAVRLRGGRSVVSAGPVMSPPPVCGSALMLSLVPSGARVWLEHSRLSMPVVGLLTLSAQECRRLFARRLRCWSRSSGVGRRVAGLGLLEQPAAWSLPSAFAAIVLVSVVTRRWLSGTVGGVMVRLRFPSDRRRSCALLTVRRAESTAWRRAGAVRRSGRHVGRFVTVTEALRLLIAGRFVVSARSTRGGAGSGRQPVNREEPAWLFKRGHR